MSVTLVINGGGNFEETMNKNRRAQDSLYKDTAKWLAAIKTPQEKHNENVRKLGELWEKDKISAQEYGRAVEVSHQRMNKALDAAIIKAQLLNDVQDQGAKKTEASTLSVGKMAAQWLSVGVAINTAQKALEAYDQARRRSADEQSGAVADIGALQQLSGGDPAQFAKLTAAARSYRVQAGLGQGKAGEAYRTINDLANNNMLDKAGLFAEMRGSNMVQDTNALLLGAGAIRFNDPNAGDLTNILATSMAAAGTSSKNLEPIMQYMGKVSSSGQPLGLGFNQSAALMSVGATSTGSAERGAEMMSSLLNEIVQKGSYRPGMSIGELVDANKGVQFGNVAAQGYRALSGQTGKAAVDKAMADIATAQANPEKYLMDAATSASRSDTPEGQLVRAERRRGQAEAVRAMAQEQLGIGRIEAEATAAEYQAKAGSGFLSVAGSELGAGFATSLPGGTTGAAAMVGGGAGAFRSIPSGAVQAAAGGAGMGPLTNILGRLAETLSSQPKAPPLPSVSP